MEKTALSPHLKESLKQLGIVNPETVTTKQASGYLTLVKGIPTAASSLEVYRSKGCGPKYKKVRSRCFYTLEWLDEHARGVEVKIFDPTRISAGRN